MPTESELRHNPGLDPLPDVDALRAEIVRLRAAVTDAETVMFAIVDETADSVLAVRVAKNIARGWLAKHAPAVL